MSLSNQHLLRAKSCLSGFARTLRKCQRVHIGFAKSSVFFKNPRRVRHQKSLKLRDLVKLAAYLPLSPSQTSGLQFLKFLHFSGIQHNQVSFTAPQLKFYQGSIFISKDNIFREILAKWMLLKQLLFMIFNSIFQFWFAA